MFRDFWDLFKELLVVLACIALVIQMLPVYGMMELVRKLDPEFYPDLLDALDRTLDARYRQVRNEEDRAIDRIIRELNRE